MKMIKRTFIMWSTVWLSRCDTLDTQSFLTHTNLLLGYITSTIASIGIQFFVFRLLIWSFYNTYI